MKKLWLELKRQHPKAKKTWIDRQVAAQFVIKRGTKNVNVGERTVANARLDNWK
jgi:hypothetical protein